MPNFERSDHRLPDREPANAATRFESKAIRWDLWLSVVAAVSVMLVVGGGLLTLTVEMRSGRAPDHEVQMDKAAAIHKLLFRR